MKISIVALIIFAAGALAQESPTPTETPGPTPAVNISPTASATPTPSATHSVRISFLPPPLEGKISLGIYDANGKLVRVLHHEAELKEFTIGADGLITTWDGKNDAGEDLPAGKYHAHGYAIGDVKIDNVQSSPSPNQQFGGAEKILVKLVANPLSNDAKTTVDLVLGSDANGTALKTMDGLPLIRIDNAQFTGAQISQRSDKSLDVAVNVNGTPKQFHITGAEKMMAFDCGEIELK